MKIDNLKIGDEFELKVVMARIVVPFIQKVKVHSIYDKFIVLDNGKWKFSALKFDLLKDDIIVT